jgi:hypothetical protein
MVPRVFAQDRELRNCGEWDSGVVAAEKLHRPEA